MRPVAEFAPRPPIRLWQAHDMDCAVYASRMGAMNGYVRLPQHHAERVIAEAMDEVERPERASRWTQLTGRTREPSKGGYDHVDVVVHGGLTYGPDEEGWVGFDTAHAWDVWSAEELEAHLLPVDAETFFAAMRLRALIGPVMSEPGWTRVWTFDALVVEVEALAAQLAGVDMTAFGGSTRPVV